MYCAENDQNSKLGPFLFSLLYIQDEQLNCLYSSCIFCIFFYMYTEYAGLEISVSSCIASSFSRQIANVNAGPVLALESMGANQTFSLQFLKYWSQL